MHFRLGLTQDFRNTRGEIGWGDIGLGALEPYPDITWDFLADSSSEIPPDVADEYDALLVLAPRVTAETVSGARRLKLVARFGVGYDNVDVNACTRAGVLVTITPDGVRRPVATGALALILASTHNLLAKDTLTRSDRWQDKLDSMGLGLTGKTLGIVGLGNTGRELVSLSRALGLKFQAYDPYLAPEVAESLGVHVVDLPTLMATSDIVCVMAALTPETRHLIGEREIGIMKSSAHFINVARGGIVDQAALTAALSTRAIRGAGLDVFDPEPPDPDDPLLSLDNVVLTPHAVCWTDELALGSGSSALRAVIDVAHGRMPAYSLNPLAGQTS
jgi:phosphoglycerate dehydrogenase-like enzyme